MSLKTYIEQNLFSEQLLPEFPFLKKGWGGYVISGDGGSIDEKDFESLKICIDQFTHDSSIKCCLTTFYDPNEASWLSEWETHCDWIAFTKVIDDYSFVSYSGMYFFGSSEKWGCIVIDGELVVLGGEACFIRKFEEVSGGYLSLKNRFDRECLRKTYAFYESFLMKLRNTFYSSKSSSKA